MKLLKHVVNRTILYVHYYHIAGFLCEDFNLAIGLIHNIKIRKVFNYIAFNPRACIKLANRSAILESSSLLQLCTHLVWHSHAFMHYVIDRVCPYSNHIQINTNYAVANLSGKMQLVFDEVLIYGNIGT